MTAPVSLDAALAAVRNVGDGPRLLEQANRIADGLEARIGTARKFVEALECTCWGTYVPKPNRRYHPRLTSHCDRCQLLDILGGGT